MKKKDSIIKGIVNSVLPVILAFAFGAIIIAAIGESPLETYGVLIRKSLLTEKGFMNTLHYASPLILTGLAIAITFKANLYNMGVEGQDRVDAEDLLCRTALEGIYNYHIKREDGKNE